MKIHVGIVSDQILPNLIPALMERPDLVCLACSETMAARGIPARLARQLKQQAIAVQIHENAPEVGLSMILRYAFEMAEKVQEAHPDAEIVLNATGGTKLMTLGFVEAFRSIGARIIYTDTSHRRIECLPDGNSVIPEALPMRDVLKVPDYLRAQGFQAKSLKSDDHLWREGAASRKQVCKYLGQHASKIQDFIGALNGMANAAIDREGNLVSPVQSLGKTPWGKWAEALGKIAAANLLRWQDGCDEVEFVNEEALQFLHGGWLEEYVWHVLKDNGAFDCKLGVKGVWEAGDNSLNEFDVIAAHCNQLLFVECKTLKYNGENDNEIAYKVESLGKQARGLFGESWVVSARTPTEVMHERAKQANLRVIGPEDLHHLKEIVIEWIRGND